MAVVTVASGFAVSSALAVKADRPLGIVVASHIARGWNVSVSVDGTAWAPLRRADGSGLAHVVGSGAGPMACVVEVPVSLVRIETSSVTVAPVSVSIVPVNRA